MSARRPRNRTMPCLLGFRLSIQCCLTLSRGAACGRRTFPSSMRIHAILATGYAHHAEHRNPHVRQQTAPNLQAFTKAASSMQGRETSSTPSVHIYSPFQVMVLRAPTSRSRCPEYINFFTSFSSFQYICSVQQHVYQGGNR